MQCPRTTAFALALVLVAPPRAERFTEQAWEANRDIYRAILAHPFLKEMQTGALAQDKFTFYLLQDAFYLREFARALEATAVKAPRKDWKELLLRHARESVAAEVELHESILNAYGISKLRQDDFCPSPEAFAYASYLVATAATGSFEESMAALLPCYWIYWEVGKELTKTGSANPHYQEWIDTYASPSYGDVVKAVMAIVDEAASRADAETVQKMKHHFRRASRYEWMFWDSAYAKRPWPPR